MTEKPTIDSVLKISREVLLETGEHPFTLFVVDKKEVTVCVIPGLDEDFNVRQA